MRLPDPARSRAVLMGIGAYQHLPALSGVHQGAAALRAALTDPRYGSLRPEHCLLLPEDAGREAIGHAITMAARDAEDLLLIYFAGHGELGRRRGDLHLALLGTHSDDVAFSSIRYDDVRDVVLDSAARSKVVILDCCYSGRALGQAMSGGTALVGEVDIEGTAVLTSAPPNAQSRVLDGERYPAYTSRLLTLLREGIPGEPELLTLPVLHRYLRGAVKAAGLREPQAKLNPLLDQLGLVRNRAGETERPEQPEQTVWSEDDEPVSAERLAQWSRSTDAGERAHAYQSLLGELGAGRINPAALMGETSGTAEAEPSRRSPGLRRQSLPLVTKPVLGAVVAFLVLVMAQDLMPGFGATGNPWTGIVLSACAALLIAVTESVTFGRVGKVDTTAVGSFLATLGMMLLFGSTLPVAAISIVAVAAYTGLVRAMHRQLARHHDRS